MKLRIATRKSELALTQTRWIGARIRERHPDVEIEEVAVVTRGDEILDMPLTSIGGKGLFVTEVEQCIVDGRADIAVHSMKDVPTWLPDGIVLPCMLEREDPRDAFICNKAPNLAALPAGSVVGTSSLRRQAQILYRRPDLKVAAFRGNVQTRMKKLEEGVVDATLLALAGLKRLGMADAATNLMEPEDMLPAVAQGAIGVTCRENDENAHQLLAPLNHPETFTAASSERALLAALDGSCRTPIAALAEITGSQIRLRGLIARPGGGGLIETDRYESVAGAEALGREAGEELKRRAGPGFFKGFQ